jgi:hypothetical protein
MILIGTHTYTGLFLSDFCGGLAAVGPGDAWILVLIMGLFIMFSVALLMTMLFRVRRESYDESNVKVK